MQGISDAIALAVGGDHACVLQSTRTIACWGQANLGQLGDNSPAPSTTSGPSIDTVENQPVSIPVTVTGINNATAIS